MRIYSLIALFLVCSCKYYTDYAAREGCEAHKECFYSNPVDFIFYVARGLDLDPLSSDPALDQRLNLNFKLCMNKMFLCGYVPFLDTLNFPSSSFGVTVGIGYDTSVYAGNSLDEMNLSDDLKTKLKPFFYFTGRGAYERALLFDLKLEESEVYELYQKSIEYVYQLMVKDIEGLKAKEWFEQKTDDNFRKALLSMYAYFDGFGSTPAISSAIAKQDTEAVKEAFYNGDYRRKYDDPYLRRFAEKILLSTLNVKYYGNVVLSVIIDLSPEKETVARSVLEKLWLDNFGVKEYSGAKLRVITYSEGESVVSKDFSADKLEWNSNQKAEISLEEALNGEVLEIQANRKNMNPGIIMLLTSRETVDFEVGSLSNVNIVPVTVSNKRLLNLEKLTNNKLYNVAKYSKDSFSLSEVYPRLLPYIFMHHTEVSGLSTDNTLEMQNYLHAKENPVFYRVSKEEELYLKINIDSEKEDFEIKVFVDYNNPFPSEHLFLYSHSTSDKKRRELIVDNKTASEANKDVFVGVYGNKSAYKVTFSLCDPRFCHHRNKGSSMISTLFITFMTAITLLYGAVVFFYFYFVTRKEEINQFNSELNKTKQENQKEESNLEKELEDNAVSQAAKPDWEVEEIEEEIEVEEEQVEEIEIEDENMFEKAQESK